jgi:hypothetical protein
MKDAKQQGKVILFPPMIEEIQREIIEYLEQESYGKAIHLLEFVTRCRIDDRHTSDQWMKLLHGLKQQFPEAGEQSDMPEEEETFDERQWLHHHLMHKINRDQQYLHRLMETFELALPDLQLQLLPQLAVSESPLLVEKMKLMLQERPLHPMVRFRILQTLCKLGVSGLIRYMQMDEQVAVEIAHTPLKLQQFPAPLLQIYDRVRIVLESEDLTLMQFTEQMWEEFLSHIYGTSIYSNLLSLNHLGMNQWAAALHAFVAQAVYGDGEQITLAISPHYADALQHESDSRQAIACFQTIFARSGAFRV